jgi:uncharacterized protein with GYD domain
MAAKPKARTSSSRPIAPVAQQHYLIQFSYTSDAWDAMLSGPAAQRDRVEAVRELVAYLGGCIGTVKFECDGKPYPTEKWGTFGDHDVALLVAFPSDEAAATFAIMIAAGGAVTNFKTTRILAWDQMMSAMANASGHRAIYKPPQKGR